MTNNNVQALHDYNARIKAAVEFTDPNWTNSAITRERIKRVAAARAELRAAIPAPTVSENTGELRQGVLDQLRPHDADTVAVVTNEWAKVEKLLAAGRNFDQLIRQADARRLAAILDRLPTELAIQSPDPDGVIQEVEQLTLARLAELGDAKAVEFAEVDREARYENAWAGVVAEAERGEVSVAA